MNRILACLILGAVSLNVQAASVSVEACVSTIFTEVATGNDVAGFSSTCYPLEGEAMRDENLTYKSAADSERRDFLVGLCNTSGATIQYTARHELRYTITESTVENERVNVSVYYDPIPETATEGNGTVTSTRDFEVPDGICADYVFNLSASYQVSSSLYSNRLSNNHDINGLFFDPNNPGHGFDFNAHEQGLTVYYYGHTASGERLWLISDLVRGPIRTFEEVTIDIYEVPDGTFGQPQGGAVLWGTLVLTLWDCDNAYAVLDGKDGRLVMNLERLVGLGDSACF
jgi:hypothetical protein